MASRAVVVLLSIFSVALIITLIAVSMPKPAPCLQPQSAPAPNGRTSCLMVLQRLGIPLNESSTDVARPRVKRRGGHGGHGGRGGRKGGKSGRRAKMIYIGGGHGSPRYYARSGAASKVFCERFGGPFPDIGINKAKSGQRPLEDPKCYLENGEWHEWDTWLHTPETLAGAYGKLSFKQKFVDDQVSLLGLYWVRALGPRSDGVVQRSKWTVSRFDLMIRLLSQAVYNAETKTLSFPELRNVKSWSCRPQEESPEAGGDEAVTTENSTGPVDFGASASIVPTLDEAVEDLRFAIAAILFSLSEVFYTASFRDLDFFYGLIQSGRVTYVA